MKQAGKRKGGQPTRYKAEYCELAFNYCLLGASDAELAQFFDVAESTINNWKKEHPEFLESICRGVNGRPEFLSKREARLAKRREYKKKPHIKKYNSEYVKNKLKEDPRYRLRFNMASLMRSRLKKPGKQGCFRHFGYTVNELIEHLELLFVDGMAWSNYGEVWHVDHRVPDSWFDYSSKADEGFKQSWALGNLQPLFKEENLKKGNRYAS